MRGTVDQTQGTPTWEKVPHDWIVHESAWEGEGKGHAKPEVTWRAPLVCVPVQLSLVFTLHLPQQANHVSSGVTYTICRMVVQEKSMATAHTELVNFIWKKKKKAYLFFSFNFFKRYVSLDLPDSNLKKNSTKQFLCVFYYLNSISQHIGCTVFLKQQFTMGFMNNLKAIYSSL